MTAARVPLVALLLLAAACADDEASAGVERNAGVGRDTGRTGDDGLDASPDTGFDDTGTADTAPADTAPADTGLDDTGAVDTTPADTGTPDTVPVDTTPTDTTPVDTGTADTTPADTGTADTTPAGLDCSSSDEHRYACCVLDETAFWYADYMATNGVFAHSADGRNFGERLDAFDVAWASAGENLQRNSLRSWESACQETVRGSGGWLNSRSGHREAMLGQDASGVDKRWTHAAAGVARAGGQWYVAMYFVKF
jgi:hypothetical protein